MFFSRIVCEMGKAEKSQYTGYVQVCVGVGECRPEFMAKSSKYYYFVVSLYFNYLTFVFCHFLFCELNKAICWLFVHVLTFCMLMLVYQYI